MQDRISAIKANQLKELQLRLFPELPDDRRAAPNVVVCSSVFGVVRRGNRVRVTDLPVAAPQRLEIAITGWRLDQHDLIGFAIDNATGEAVCITNSLLRPLFKNITHLNIEQRRALGQDQLAEALHALLASHAEWLPLRVDTLMQRLGAHYDRLRDFKRDLKPTLVL